ncbi:MAG: OsmC family protein [Candidatus Thiodiazotropha sp.]
MSEEVGKFTIHLEQEEDYAFRVKFDLKKADDILMDEPPPLGERNGPNASRLLAAAAANCLSASLMFCLAKEDVPARTVKSEATCTMIRNDKKRLRVGRIDVRITAGDELLESKKRERCMSLFEDFCVVTGSIRQGIPVGVEVYSESGDLLHKAEE